MESLCKLVDELSSKYSALSQNQTAAYLLAERVFVVTAAVLASERKGLWDAIKHKKLLDLLTHSAGLLLNFLPKNIRNSEEEEGRFGKKHVYIRESQRDKAEFENLVDQLAEYVKTAKFKVPDLISDVQQIQQEAELCRQPKMYKPEYKNFFVGRENQLKETINQVLHSEGKLKVLLVSGPSGAGKTAFAREIANNLAKEYSDRHYYLHCGFGTSHPLTTMEAMANVVKRSSVGTLPVAQKDSLKKAYNVAFEGKKCLLFIEEPNSTSQVLQLLPRVEDLVTKVCVIITSKRILKIDQFAGKVLNPGDVVEAKGDKDQGEYGEDTSDDEGEAFEIIVDDDDDAIEQADATVIVLSKAEEAFEEGEQIFPKNLSNSVTVDNAEGEVEEDSDDENNFNKIEFPKNYTLIFSPINHVSTKEAVNILRSINPKLELSDCKSFCKLAANLPLFLTLFAETSKRLSANQKVSGFIKEVSDELSQFGINDEEDTITQICLSYLLTCLNKLQPVFKNYLVRLTVFPNSFSIHAAAAILEKGFAETAEIMEDLCSFGLIERTCHCLRFTMHDMIRESLTPFVKAEDILADTLITCKERFLQYYFDLMVKSNMEHEFSGVAVLSGLEIYDRDLENMKEIFDFLRNKSDQEYLDVLNSSRYIVRARWLGETRGYRYNTLKAYVEKLSDEELTKAEYYEGFASVYWDLTDRNQGFTLARKALDIKYTSVAANGQELELLSALKLVSEMFVIARTYDNAEPYLNQMIELITNNAQEWQKEKRENDTLILDPYLAFAYTSMGIVMTAKSDSENATKFFNLGLHISKRLYGDSHPMIAHILIENAKNLRPQRKYKEIDQLYSDALSIYRTALGELHPSVADIMDEWAVCLLEQGKYHQAEDLYKDALRIRQKQYGENHEAVAASYNNMAISLKNQGRYEDAAKLYSKCLEILVTVKGNCHKDVAIATSNLGHVKVFTQHFVEAEELFAEAIAILKKCEGDGSELVASMYNSIGDTLRTQEQHAKAIVYFEEALKIRRKLNGDDDPSVASTISSIANFYFDQQQYEKAEALYQQALDILVPKGDQASMYRITCLSNLGNAKFKLGKYEDAEQIFRRVIEERKTLGEAEIKLIPTVLSLSIVMEKQKNYAEAENMYRELWELRMKAPKQTFREKEDTLNALAGNMGKQGNYSGAVEVYGQMLQLIKVEVGEDSINTARTLCNIGAAYVYQQNWGEAEKVYAKALGIYETKNDPATEETAENLSQVRVMLAQQRHRAGQCCVVL